MPFVQYNPYTSFIEKEKIMADNQGNPQSWLQFIFGKYTLPGFITALGRLLKKASTNFGRSFKAHKVRYFIIYALIILCVGGVAGIRFLLSRRPQPISISYSVRKPENVADPEYRTSLEVWFKGSAAPVDMVDKEITEGISIDPPIKGTWKWMGDDALHFTTETNWVIGRKYTVNFAKDFFPAHVNINKSFSFSIEDFSLSLNDVEFYIDPEDSAIKRILGTVRTNYPMDTASLEKSIVIEPQIKADSGRLQKRRYTFTVNYNKAFTEAYIVSEPLGMPSKAVDMILSIQKGVRAAAGEGSPGEVRTYHVEIPGMTSYVYVQDLGHDLIKNADQKYDQVFIIDTRGTVDEAELSKNITVYELPVDRPELPGIKAEKNHSWYNVSEMLPEVLQLSRKIESEAIPSELKYNSVNSYKFSAEPGRFVYVKINNGTKFYGGYVLNEPYEAIFRVKNYPKELSILSDGSILSFSGEKRLAMMTRGVSNVKYTIGRIRPDDINHLVSQTSGDVTNINFRNYNFNQYNITEQFSETTYIPLASERELGYFSFDFSRYLNNIPEKNLRHGFFIFSVQGDENNSNYQDRRIIMVTDLGFFVKTNTNGTQDIFVQSISTGNPVGGALVQVLGLNGNPLVTSYTGNDGHVQVPGFSDYKNERAPTVYTVRSGEDMSFMAYRSSGRNLDYSSFEVGGLYGADDPKTLRAFLFSDRGLYRPGDEVRIGMAVKSGDWRVNLARTPLECKVTDPRGAEIYSKRISLSSEGVEEIRFSTQDWSPTGTYTTTIYVIRERKGGEEEQVFLGSQTVKVEEFLPDTLNVSAVFDPVPQGGWIAPSELKARVTVRNLFGTAAAGNEVKAQINLSPGHQYFREFRDYQFQDPYLAKNSYQEYLGSQNTGNTGEAEFSLNTAKFEKATYNLTFYTEAFEKGSGRNVSAEARVYVSPLPYLIGYKADGNLNYIQRDTARTVSFIAISPRAEKTAVNDVTMTLTELRYVSVLVRQPNGVYKYQSVQKEYPVSSEKISIPAAGFEYHISTANPGEYRLLLTGSTDELEYNRVIFSVAGTQNIQRSLNRTAELNITLNKNDFAAGENIQLMIKAPYEGAGLITIERDKVYGYKWFHSTGETTLQTIAVPADLEGNGYVNVQFVRSQSSPEIFMSPLSYGAMPFSISKENRTNRISLDFPAEAKPGKDFAIKYSTPHRGKIIIYAVDEGILQLAAYQTPDPLAFFFRKRALEVRTAQILDMVLPEFSVVRTTTAMGGGGGYDELSRNLNPFKRRQNAPVAYWSGIVDTGPEQRTLNYHVPDYFNGTLRVMAVSVSDDTVGAAEDRALIQSTFIISPNSPMMAAPGDEFAVSLTVTNMQKGSGAAGKVHLAAKASEHLVLTEKTEFDLNIPEGKDQTLTIPVKAAGPVGAAEIRFIASNQGESSELAAYMSVRPSVPYRVSLYSGAIKNKSTEVAIDRNLYDEFHTRDVSLSYLPVGLAKGLSFYLESYPYGCSEQLVSAAFPFLYPHLFKELGFTRAEAEAGVGRVIGILQARMKEDGSIGMWTSHSEADPLITIYAAHFLTEARNSGYYVSPAVMNKLLQSIRGIAGSSGTSLYGLSCRSYAIYMLTLNEIVTTPLVESLKKDIDKSNKEAETELPGLYLAGTYALLQKNSDAAALLGKIKRTLRKDNSLRYIDDLMYHSVYLNMVARHFPQRLKDVSESLFLSMSDRLENQDYTTASANYALMGIDAYLKVVPTAETGRFTVLEILKDNQKRQISPAGTTLFSASFSGEAQKISLENKDQLNLFYQITAAGFEKEPPAAEIKNGIEIYREFLNDAGQVISSAKMGDAVTVRLNFRTVTDRTIRDVAIVDLLPAGLESDIQSIRNASSGGSSGWRPDYADIREDRLVIYGTVGPKVSSFTYRTRAINSGSFIVPPLFAEAMYDKSVWAMRPQGKLTIAK
jgi:uncharacterized protein YfaS (alpha-2-macroglobulin family)